MKYEVFIKSNSRHFDFECVIEAKNKKEAIRKLEALGYLANENNLKEI